MSTNYFHFTLGPVQGFVAQARRTRDFWAGSFILSWLSSIAMLAVQKQQGEILFPHPDPAFMRALERGGEGPKQGNVPNRFKASVPAGFNPEKISNSVEEAWEALAERIWQADLAKIAGTETRNIWVRQIQGFWEIQWALVKDEHEANILDRLKNWRTHLPPDEPGIKCMMMDGWQELSGSPSPVWQADDTESATAFWKKVREQKGIESDLREKEMLCAIAFIKRRFARHFWRSDTDKFELELPDMVLRGWKLPPGVPSVHYMAAAHWLETLIKRANADEAVENALWRFHDEAHKLTGEHAEWDSNIRCVREAGGRHKWQALNGEVFFESMLENGKLWDSKQMQAKALAKQLRDLRRQADLDPAPPFYAVLLMDGDELGSHLNDPDQKQRKIKQNAISIGLTKFTREVADIVNAHSGFLIYAGGDDVLALLPLEDALRCAAALRAHYLDCFDAKVVPTTLSGAIEYAHAKMPLGKVLSDAHDLLDRVAKDGRGRDAIACRVWKPGGQNLEWAMPWKCALEHSEPEAPVVVDRLAERFRDQAEQEGRDMASGFFYRMQEHFELLNPVGDGATAVLNETEATDLLAMEYLNSGVVRDKRWDMEQARQMIRPLLDQCRLIIRDKTILDPADWKTLPLRVADGALLVHFLANKGVER